MITWFEVENFKSIRKLRLDMRPFMVLVGANAAGKTNIVQALALFLDILSRADTTPVERHGGLEALLRRGPHPARVMRFALRAPFRDPPMPGFEGQHGTIQIEIALRARGDVVAVVSEEVRLEHEAGKPFVLRWTPRGVEASGERAGPVAQAWIKACFGVTDESDIARSVERRRPEELRFLDLYRYARQTFLPTMRSLRLDASSLRRDAESGQPGDFDPTGRGLPGELEKLRPRSKPPTAAFKRVLARIQEIYPNIEDISTVHVHLGRIALSFRERTIDGSLGESSVSDGVMHALALLMALEGAGRLGVLAIEEPENAIHPWALRKLISYAQEKARSEPLLLTTHSPVVVSAVQDPSSLYIVERNERQETVIAPALHRERELAAILAETGQQLGDVWLDGSLGGVPQAST